MPVTDDTSPELAALATAVLRLLIDEREARIRTQPDSVPTEVLLGGAGLTSVQIGKLVGKTPGNVRTAQSRAKAPAKKLKNSKRTGQ